MFDLILCLLSSLYVIEASLFCPYTKYPTADADFRTMTIQIKERAEQEAMYRISDDEFDQGFVANSTSFRLFTSTDNTDCPAKACLTEISAAEPKHHGSILYHTSVLGKVIPPGFQAIDASRRVYCVVFEGDCGATIPIYRYYRITSQGIYHAYTTDGHKQLSNYTSEPTPLCYAWPTQRVQESTISSIVTPEVHAPTTILVKENLISVSEETCSHPSSELPSSDAMKALHVYDNHRGGPMRDHYYTTRTIDTGDVKNLNSVYYNYTLTNDIGAIVVDEKASRCECLIKLTQMLEYSEGIIRMLDHKLLIQDEETPSARLINQTSTGEDLFCVKEEGACGATLPLRKYFHIGDLDTIYTVNSTETPLFTVPTPAGVLCYIWNIEEVSNSSSTSETEPTLLRAGYTIDPKNNSLNN
uniref:Uncharacterized protein n=1 Tax=Acrobeloides nanus TaxID=290746 RepID=A0A914BXN0_9BILA